LTLDEILAAPKKEGWAVPAFDVLNLEVARAVADGAAAENAPVIFQLYPAHFSLEHYPTFAAMIEAEVKRTGVKACLQLDHGENMKQVHAALESGFSAVMVDGSKLPLEKNIALTQKTMEAARAVGASVEAELGHVGLGSEELSAQESASRLTRVDDAIRFVAETEVDALAVAIGTAHGLYRGTPKLDFPRLSDLCEAVSVPMVLHGGSGTPDADVKCAVAGGICKVNIWTELALVFTATLQDELARPVKECDLAGACHAAQLCTQEVVQQKIRLLGAAGRAA
jgi:fructose-bisphosphate aldolase class II